MRLTLVPFLAVILISRFAPIPVGVTTLDTPFSTQASNPDPKPVVLELFTSEGCSSCPPADALLKKLDDAGSLDNVEIIAIEEHVDYWNRLGWTDPFSSSDWTERQQHYSQTLRRDGVYTPQLVVNGHDEFVGSSERQLREAIANAEKVPAATLRFASVNLTSNSAELSIALEGVQDQARSSELWLAVTERGLSSNVLRGENQGRNLVHAAILRSLTRVRMASSANSDSANATKTIKLNPTWKRENLRFVVFLQEPKSLRILGAASAFAPR